MCNAILPARARLLQHSPAALITALTLALTTSAAAQAPASDAAPAPAPTPAPADAQFDLALALREGTEPMDSDQIAALAVQTAPGIRRAQAANEKARQAASQALVA